jgi:hypothetical protein
MNKSVKADEWATLYGEWQKSGETQRVFCKRKGISFSSFKNRHRSMRRKVNGVGIDRQILPVRVIADQAAASEFSPDVFLQFPNGLCLRFVVGTCVGYIASLVEAMGGSKPC